HRRVSWRDRRCRRGRERDGRGLRGRRRDQGCRDRDRQGLPGHDQAPQLRERPAGARLAQRSRSGVGRRLGDALARLQGRPHGGPHGRQARDPDGAHRARHRRRAQPAPGEGLRPGTEERARGGPRLMAAPKAPVLSANGGAKEASLDAVICGGEVKPHLVHEAVRAEQASQRAGTFASKSRGLVSGGRSKPWRQKGTGRARAGTTRAPQFTGGGHAFNKVPRSFDLKVNRKVAKAALRSALAGHAGAGTLALLDATTFEAPSPTLARSFLEASGLPPPPLVGLPDGGAGAAKSFRNLARVAVVAPSELEVGAVVWARSLVVSEGALPTIETRAR